jgi:hypothetical protein
MLLIVPIAAADTPLLAGAAILPVWQLLFINIAELAKKNVYTTCLYVQLFVYTTCLNRQVVKCKQPCHTKNCLHRTQILTITN